MNTTLPGLPQGRPAVRQACDEAMQECDRRFFELNPARTTYLRFASDVEETGYRAMRGIPNEAPGLVVMAVRQIEPGFRIRNVIEVPITFETALELPADNETCLKIFGASGGIIVFERGRAYLMAA